MRKSRSYTPEEKAQILEEVKSTGNVKVVAQRHSMPPSTIATWIKPRYKKKDKITRDYDQEIKELKTKLEDSDLENKILKELLKKTYQIWDTD